MNRKIQRSAFILKGFCNIIHYTIRKLISIIFSLFIYLGATQLKFNGALQERNKEAPVRNSLCPFYGCQRAATSCTDYPGGPRVPRVLCKLVYDH